MKRALLGLVGLLVVGASTLGIGVWRAVSPTSGPHIEAGRRGKALILVDLQEDYTGLHAKQPYNEASQLISAANQLMEAARAGGWPAYLVRIVVPNDWFHKLMTGGTAIAGTKGAEFDSRLLRAPDTVEIVKTKSDSFSNPLLDAQLAAHDVGEIYIAGLDARFCVMKTIGGALNRGYKVSVVREAIATRHGTPLDELIRGYEAGGAVMKSLDQAKGELQPPAGGARHL